MDERLQAGRHHLLNGERALQTGYPEDGRQHFHAALLQFRGPDLRLGEAHALRGLAQVEMALGDLEIAEGHIREAIVGYQAVHGDLDRLDAQGVSHELRRDAREGEGAAMVVLGEILMRVGNNEESRTALSYAREIANDLGELPSSASAYASSARLALHEGRYDDAQELLDRTLKLQTRSGNASGQVEAWLMVADLRRLRKDLPGSEAALGMARPLATQSQSATLEGRVLSMLASLLLQQNRLDEARQSFAEALPFARKGGDTELIGHILVGLGDATSRMHEGFGLEHLIEGSRILAARENRQGVATGLLRIGEHALRMNAPDLALAAAEGARRMYSGSDPVRGVGYALRVIVKALAAMQRWEAVLVAATAREAIAGAIQQNARDVAAFYRDRVPPEWVEALKPLGLRGITERCETMVGVTLQPTLGEVGLSIESLGTIQGVLAVVEAIATRLPKPSPPEAWERDISAPEPAAATPEGPPDEEAVIPPGQAPVVAEPQDLPFESIEPLTEDVPRPVELPPIGTIAPTPPEAASEPGVVVATAYDADYDPPPPVGPSPEPAPEPAAADPEPDAPIPEDLKKAPPPSGYDYDLPEEGPKG
jgi:tetratricopeptide (TPR) repeat protein